MAEIGVERKRPSIWPWIIGLAVLAILIWLMLEMFDSGDEMEAPVLTDTAGVVQELPAPAVSDPAAAEPPSAGP